MLLHFMAVPTTETNELRRKHSACNFSWQNPWRKKVHSRRSSLAPAPATLLSVPKASWEILVKRLRDKPMSFFPLFLPNLKFVAQFFRADSDFIILAVKESRISSCFKSHTLFYVNILSFNRWIVSHSCLSSFLVVETVHKTDKISQKSPEFPEIMKIFIYEQNYVKHAIKFLRLLNQIKPLLS